MSFVPDTSRQLRGIVSRGANLRFLRQSLASCVFTAKTISGSILVVKSFAPTPLGETLFRNEKHGHMYVESKGLAPKLIDVFGRTIVSEYIARSGAQIRPSQLELLPLLKELWSVEVPNTADFGFSLSDIYPVGWAESTLNRLGRACEDGVFARLTRQVYSDLFGTGHFFVHGDLCPENMIRGDQGGMLLIDFECSQRFGNREIDVAGLFGHSFNWSSVNILLYEVFDSIDAKRLFLALFFDSIRRFSYYDRIGCQAKEFYQRRIIKMSGIFARDQIDDFKSEISELVLAVI